MDREEFVRQLQALRRGELTLEPPEDNGLSRFAGGRLYELREYISALEAGYRLKTGQLAAYRSKARGRSLGEVVRDRWSDGAALGYAAMAAIDCGLTPSATVELLEQMEDIMETVSRDAAAEYCQTMKEGGPPEWVGPGAELLPREPGAGNRQQGTGDADSSAPLGMTGTGVADCHGLRPRNDRDGGGGHG